MFRAGERQSPRGAGRAIRRHPAADDGRRGAGRGRALPVLLRRPVHPGLPDAHRRAPVHPPDPASRRDRRGPDDPRRQHLRRELRRACPTEVLCEGACVDQMLMKAPVQIGRLAAVRLRHRRGAAASGSSSRAPPTGRRRGRDRLGTGRAELRPRAAAARARRGRLRGPRSARRPGHARHRRLQDLDRVRAGRDRADPRDRHRDRARPPRDGRRGPCDARRVRRRVPGHRPGPDRAAGDRGRRPRRGLGGARLHLPDPHAAIHRVRRRARTSW